MSGKTEVTAEVIVHATEDIGRFYRSFEELLGLRQDQFDARELTGHFENPITVLGAKVTGDAARKLVRRISAEIPEMQGAEFAESLDGRIDGSGLHLRLGKQEFVHGRMVLQEEDAIKMRIQTPVYRRSEISEAYRALLGLRLD